MANTFRQIAWNGIRLSIPGDWQLVGLDSHHLTFQSHRHPAMEIKWGAIKGRFSHNAQLKKINKAHPARNIGQWQLPSAWKQALGSYSSQGFAWQTGPDSGRGATLFCPACSRAIVFQLFNVSRRLSDPGLLQVIASLSDHRRDGFTAWKVFDIEALLPKTLRLDYHHFKPGSHVLAFSNKSMAVRLHRWAPASALLSDSSLSAFAGDALSLGTARLRSTTIQGFPAVEWRDRAAGGWRNRLNRWHRRPADRWVAVWHIEKHNRILGINFESTKPLNPDQVVQISNNFTLDSFA